MGSLALDGEDAVGRLVACAFALPAGEDGAHGIADERVLHVCERETADYAVGVGLDFGFAPGGGETAARGVEDVFAHSKFGEDDVVLENIVNDPFVAFG